MELALRRLAELEAAFASHADWAALAISTPIIRS
jgi:hypothetical protein